MLTKGIVSAAIEEAEKSTYCYHLGAVLFKGKRILSVGHNGLRNASMIPNRKYPNSLHAEQAVLLNVDWTRLKGCDIFVCKVSKKHKELSMAKPCAICQRILKDIGIRNMYYTNSEGLIIKEKINEQDPYLSSYALY